MTTFTVTTAADVVDAADGVLSLREAVQLANTDPAAADTIRRRSRVGR
jgi:CSLREA domain-containing protein